MTISTARARLIRARTMIVNVLGDVGHETAVRNRLREVIDGISAILHEERYIVDLPAVPRAKGEGDA